MEIGIQEQEDLDLDWFCVDEAGDLGHFTTAGFKRLPASVARSAEDLKVVTEYFRNAAAIDGHGIDDGLADEIPDPANRGERYLRSFVAAADRGLFSFDIASYLKPGICYFRVAIPSKSLRFDELPDNIRDIVGRTVLKGKLLRACSRIPYQDTLGL